MKVLLLNQVFFPDRVATAQHITDLAVFLKKQGCSVSVITGRRAYENRKEVFSAKETYKGVTIHRIGSTGFGKKTLWGRLLDSLSFDLMLVFKLLFFPRQDVTVAFTSPPLIGFFGALFCLFRGGKFVQWLMDINPDAAIEVGYIKRTSILAKILNIIFNFTIKTSHKLVVLDRWMKSRVIQHGAKENQIAIVPPWPVHKVGNKVEIPIEQNLFLKEYGLVGKFIVLYSGNHSVVHPLDTVLDSAKALKDNPDVRFVFVGSGLRVKDVTTFREKHGLTNILQLPIQPREKLEHTLGSANLHVVVMGNRVSGIVHTSKIYGVLASGKPYIFVGPRKSHVVDLLTKCPYGFHVEHGEVNQFVKYTNKLMETSRLELDTVRLQNRQHVEKYYAPEKCLRHFADEVLKLDKEALGPADLRPVSVP